MNLTEINKAITYLSVDDLEKVSDGYHTFGELYDHRCTLYVALVNVSQNITTGKPFKKAKKHYDGSEFEGRFIVQGYIQGKQISYHLPMKYRDNTKCKEVENADERDGHTSQDVLDRLLLT